MLYPFLKPFLFRLDPERAHERISGLMSALSSLPGGPAALRSLYGYESTRLARNVCGLGFKNPVGMAAGFDKTARLYPFLANMGFGFVESGTFTALAQEGNPKPRLFRFPEADALVNRMGFNNPGSVEVGVTLQRQSRRGGVIRGINIGKSKVVPVEAARDDYLESLHRLLPFADYIAVNVSSPNTPGLRSLQKAGAIRSLLESLKHEIRKQTEGKPVVPLLVKLAPDLSDEELDETLNAIQEAGTDGVILTNTTLDRSAVPRARDLEGGLSGRPLRERSTGVIRHAYRRTEGRLPIIGVGGIFSGEDALEKIRAGASLIQIYTGYIYEGPGLPSRICRFLDRYLEKNNTTLADLVGSHV